MSVFTEDEDVWLYSNYPSRMLSTLYRYRNHDQFGADRGDGTYGMSNRKMLLYCVASLRYETVWDLLKDDRTRHAVLIAEHVADGTTNEHETTYAQNEVDKVFVHFPRNMPRDIAGWSTERKAWWAARSCLTNPERAMIAASHLPIEPVQADLLRDIIGNPFRPVRWPLPPPITCPQCNGRGFVYYIDVDLQPAVFKPVDKEEMWERRDFKTKQCPRCKGRFIVPGPCPIRHWNDGTVLKVAQTIYNNKAFGDMPILADALEDAGCEDKYILQHLRGFEPSYQGTIPWLPKRGPCVRGCHVLDTILMKE